MKSKMYIEYEKILKDIKKRIDQVLKFENDKSPYKHLRYPGETLTDIKEEILEFEHNLLNSSYEDWKNKDCPWKNHEIEINGKLKYITLNAMTEEEFKIVKTELKELIIS